MKKMIGVQMVLAAAVVALFAFSAAAMSHGDKGKDGLPAATGEAVMNYITKDNPYQQWQMWPGREALYEGQHPHGAFLTTYVSPAAHQAIMGMEGAIPDGGMIVKENYSPEKELAAVTVMYRVKGYAPDQGDWFWLKYAPDGTIQAEGKVGGCIGCHSSVQANDWLFTGPVRYPEAK